MIQDYLVRVMAASFAAYEQLLRNHLRQIPALASIETSFAFGVTKPLSPCLSSDWPSTGLPLE